MKKTKYFIKSLKESDKTPDSYKKFVINKINLGRKALIEGKVIRIEDLKIEIKKW